MKLSRKLFVTKVDEIGANVLKLPYENEQLAMIVVLPNPDSNVREVQAKLHKFDVSKINDKLEQVTISLSFLGTLHWDYRWKLSRHKGPPIKNQCSGFSQKLP